MGKAPVPVEENQKIPDKIVDRPYRHVLVETEGYDSVGMRRTMKNGTVLLVIGGEQKTFTTDFVFARLGREGVTKMLIVPHKNALLDI